MNKLIIPECYIDTNLTETITPPDKEAGFYGYNHQKGCGTVALVMKRDLGDSFALGIIDKDKHAVDYLKEFDEVITTPSLILHKHKTRHHYIVQVCPAMEQFILNSAAAVGISLADYGLPTDLDRLKKVSKSVNSKDDTTLKKLFKDLKKKGAPDVVRLATWIDYLKAHPYNTVIEEMKLL